jgi:hypothetical protein
VPSQFQSSSNRAPCSWAADPWAVPSIGSLSTTHRKSSSAVQHFAHVRRAFASAMPAGWDHRLHKRLLGIGQIARATKVIALCRTAVFRLPHRALPKESSATKGITSDSSVSSLGSALSDAEVVPLCGYAATSSSFAIPAQSLFAGRPRTGPRRRAARSTQPPASRRSLDLWICSRAVLIV